MSQWELLIKANINKANELIWINRKGLSDDLITILSGTKKVLNEHLDKDRNLLSKAIENNLNITIKNLEAKIQQLSSN